MIRHDLQTFPFLRQRIDGFRDRRWRQGMAQPIASINADVGSGTAVMMDARQTSFRRFRCLQSFPVDDFVHALGIEVPDSSFFPVSAVVVERPDVIELV